MNGTGKKILTNYKQYGNDIIKKIFSKQKKILIFNSFGESELNYKEYQIAEIFKNTHSYEESLTECIEKKIIKNKAHFDIIYNKLVNTKILVEVNMENDSYFINNVIIKRNGVGLGKNENGKWLVGTCASELNNSGVVTLTSKEEYRVWMCANGTSTVQDILGRIGQRMNNQENSEVTVLLERNLLNFIRLGIWEIECFNEKQTLTIEKTKGDSDVFDKENLREDTLLIPVGYELGQLNTSKNEFWISRGDEWIILNSGEYRLWNQLNKKVMKLGQLQFEYEKSQEELKNEIIIPMLEKKLIILWDSNLLSNSNIVRVSSQGNVVISNTNKYSCKFKSIIDLGYEPEVFEFSQKIWMVVSGDKTIKQIVDIVYDWDKNNTTYEETQERVLDNIRALMSLGLIKIDVL